MERVVTGLVFLSFSSAGIGLGALIAQVAGSHARVEFTRTTTRDGSYLLHWTGLAQGIPEQVWLRYIADSKARYGTAATIDSPPHAGPGWALSVAVPEHLIASAPMRFAFRFMDQAKRLTGDLVGDRMSITFEFDSEAVAEEVAGRIAAHVPRLEQGVEVRWEPTNAAREPS